MGAAGAALSGGSGMRKGPRESAAPGVQTRNWSRSPLPTTAGRQQTKPAPASRASRGMASISSLIAQ